MEKALLVVHHYISEKADDWGFIATDYATADMLKNISNLYPDYDWHTATLAQARQLLREIDIDLLLLVPILKDHIAESNAYPHVEVDYLRADEYVKISKSPFSFMRKEPFK